MANNKPNKLHLNIFSVKSIAWLLIYVIYFICLLCIVGWAFNISWLKAINPGWTPMTMIITLTIILSGAALAKSVSSVNKTDAKRKLSEEALRSSEEKYSIIYDNAPFGITLTTMPEGIIVSVNSAFLKLFGFTQEEATGKTSVDLGIIDADSRSLVAEELQRNGFVKDFECTRRAKGGDLLNLLLSLNWVNITGERYILTTIQNISERKKVEEKLKESEDRFKMALRNAPVSFAAQDRNLRYIWAYNQRSAKPEQIIGHFDSDIFTPEEAAHMGKIKQRVLEEGIELREQMWFDRPAGSMFLDICWEPVRDESGTVTGVASATIDLTPLKLAEQALQRSVKQYRLLVDISPYAIFINRNNHIVYANPAMLQMFGATSEEQILGKTPFDIYHTSFHELVKRRIEQVMINNTVPLMEVKIVRLDGSLMDVEVTGSKFTDQEGDAIQVILRDITDSKKAQAILERYRLITQYTRDPLLLIKLKGDIVEANHAAEELYGYTHEELLSLKIHNLRSEKEEVVENQMIQAKEKGLLFETIHVSKDRREIAVEVSSCSVMIDGEEMLLSVIRDITQRKKSEADLYKLNRTLKALSKSSQAMNHAEDEKVYIDEICRIVVEDCGHAMVWVGFAEDDEDKTVKPVAAAGFEDGYLETLNVTWADTERGRGPTGTAIRTGKIGMCTNMHTDPLFAPWREEALKRGYASSLVMPMFQNGKVFGAITIYSKEPDPFTNDEVNLFSELADDLSYGIMMIRLHLANRKAEESLRQSEEKLRLKLDSILSPEIEVSEQELSNIIDTQAVQALMEEFYEVTKMGMAIIDLKGNVLVGVGWQDICVKFHRTNEITRMNCLESDTILTRGVKKGEFRSYKCKNNMWDIVSPIYIGEKHIGNIFTGQFFYEDEVPDYNFFVDQAEKYNFEREDYLSALRHVPRWKRERVDSLMGFFAKFATIVSRLSYSNIKLAKAMADQKKTEEKLQESKEKLDFAMKGGNIGVWEWNPKTDEMIWDERMENIFSIAPGSFNMTYMAFENYVVEDDIPHIRKSFRMALKEETPFDTIFRIKTESGVKYLNAKALVKKNSEDTPIGMTGVCIDITEMKKSAEQALFGLNEDLLRSNKELEQFAYVASHDLQEPLRMVSSFTQLLEQRYKDKLDQDGVEFIQYAVDGARRMQTLINDLLAFSRIQTRGKELSNVDMNVVLDRTIFNLNLMIQEKQALITNDELPFVKADEVQMIQLFQNLIGNAIKFCNIAPKIHIEVKEEIDCYIFSVKDNGIGIEPQYFEKIFQIFQRLLPKDQYEGTGIGLAICKRIVQRHGGHIWVESEINKGTNFYFMLLK